MRQSITRLGLLAMLLLALAPGSATATEQLPDTAKYEGDTCKILEYPVEKLWADRRPDFDPKSTGNRKGYTATWEIRQSKLYLTSFEAKQKGKPLPINKIVPGGTLPLHATWYSGELHLGIGYLEQSGLPVFARGHLVFKRIVILQIKEGIIVGQTERRHVAWEEKQGFFEVSDHESQGDKPTQ